MRRFLWFVLILGTLLLAVGVGGYLYLFSVVPETERAVIDFATCAEKFPIMESYPRQCKTPDGVLFVEEEVDTPVEVKRTLYVSDDGAYSFEYDADRYTVVVREAGTSTDVVSDTRLVVKGQELSDDAGEESGYPVLAVTVHRDLGEPLAAWAEEALAHSVVATSTELTQLSGNTAVRVSGRDATLFETLFAMHRGNVYEITSRYETSEDLARATAVEVLGSWEFLYETPAQLDANDGVGTGSVEKTSAASSTELDSFE